MKPAGTTSTGSRILRCVSKNVLPSACYNFDVQELILTISGRHITEKVDN